MTAWLLFNGTGVVDRAGANDKEGNDNEGEWERDCSHACLFRMAALAFKAAFRIVA